MSKREEASIGQILLSGIGANEYSEPQRLTIYSWQRKALNDHFGKINFYIPFSLSLFSRKINNLTDFVIQGSENTTLSH